MLPPDPTVLAEGDLPSGHHWILKVGGSRENFRTSLETVHPDGHRDEGGMRGPLLYPGRLLNTYVGAEDRGLLRVLVRADPRVRRLRLRLADGDHLDLAPLGSDHDLGVRFFAALLPITAEPTGFDAFDTAGDLFSPQML